MNRKLGPYLREVRKSQSLTLRDVERETGISNAYLSQMENCRIERPSPSVLHKLAIHYDIAYEYLMELAGHPTPARSEVERKSLEPAFRLSSSIRNLTKEEEDKVLEYIEFLKSKKRLRK